MLLRFLLRRFIIRTRSGTVGTHPSFQINLRSFFLFVYWFGHSSWLLSAAPPPAFCFLQAISKSGASTSQQLLSEKHSRKKLLIWVLTPGENNYFWHRLSLHAPTDRRCPCSFCSCSSTSAFSWSVFHTRFKAWRKSKIDNMTMTYTQTAETWREKLLTPGMQPMEGAWGMIFIVIMSRSANTTAGDRPKRL